MRFCLVIMSIIAFIAYSEAQAMEGNLAVATFQIDATPPLGYPLRFGRKSDGSPAKKIVDPLSARGVVFLTNQSPIILCAIDWLAIGNTGHDAWRRALAEAAGTTMDRVTVHVLHQHDAPGCDFFMEEALSRRGFEDLVMDPEFTRNVIACAAQAVRETIKNPQPVTHIGIGKAMVDRVASNRRILGPDGKIQYMRFSGCPNQDIRDMPEGVIDPFVRLVSFWDKGHPIVILSYYATHPMSFYGEGAVSADFVGLARALREAAIPEVDHIHFCGAGGNIAAGKYNDRQPVRRFELATRLFEGMQAAWDATVKIPISTKDVEWRVKSVALPPAERINEKEVERKFEDILKTDPSNEDWRKNYWRPVALDFAWIRRCKAGHRIDIGCLRVGSVYILHMPGELFVEYQLAAQAMRQNDFVCMAAYGDFGPGYIGTEIAYSQGGYETGKSSRVSSDVEAVLMSTMRELLR